MNKRIGLIGIPFPLLIDYLLENNYMPVALIDKDNPSEFPSEISEQYTLSLQNRNELLADPQIHNLHLDGIICSFENYILSKSWLAEALNLPGLSRIAAEISTDKQLMRKAFAEHCPQFSPAFAEVEHIEDVQNFLQAHPGPVVIKPANLVKSLLVTLCKDANQALEAFAEIKTKIDDVYAQNGVRNRRPKIIIEEYLVGPYFSVDAVIDRNGDVTELPVVDLIMGKDRGYEDHHNYSRKLPSQFSLLETAELKTAAKAGIKAIGLKSSGAHCELVLTKHGPKLIEIGARFGGYRPLMYNECYSINLFQTDVDLALGNIPNVDVQLKSNMAVYEIFPRCSGTVSKIFGLETLEKLPSLRRYRLRTPLGSPAGPAKDGFRFSLLIQLENNNKDQFLTDTKWVEDNIEVVTEK